MSPLPSGFSRRKPPQRPQRQQPVVPLPATGATPWDFRREATREPVVYDDVRPDLCLPLADVILALAERRPSHPSLNIGGWRSDEDLFDLQHPVIQTIAQTLTQMIGGVPKAWAMVNRFGSEHKRHNHQGAIATIVYYLTAGDPIVPTIYECEDGGELAVEPHPGRLVICRGDTWHRVPRYDGATPRITIAADFRG